MHFCNFRKKFFENFRKFFSPRGPAPLTPTRSTPKSVFPTNQNLGNATAIVSSIAKISALLKAASYFIRSFKIGSFIIFLLFTEMS